LEYELFDKPHELYGIDEGLVKNSGSIGYELWSETWIGRNNFTDLYHFWYNLRTVRIFLPEVLCDKISTPAVAAYVLDTRTPNKCVQ
jgi:hypothetical protein